MSIAVLPGRKAAAVAVATSLAFTVGNPPVLSGGLVDVAGTVQFAIGRPHIGDGGGGPATAVRAAVAVFVVSTASMKRSLVVFV